MGLKIALTECKTLGLLLLTTHQHNGVKTFCAFLIVLELFEFVGKSALLVDINLLITLQMELNQVRFKLLKIKHCHVLSASQELLVCNCCKFRFPEQVTFSAIIHSF